jgi:carboxyl-terminal processing protease
VQKTEHVDGRDRKLKQVLKSGGRIAAVVAVVVVIFSAGVGVGNGTVQFGKFKNVQNKSLPDNLDYSGVENLYDMLKANYDGQLDTKKLLDGIKSGLAEASGDPYTIYLNTKEADDFSKQLNGTFSGVGAELGQDASGNLIVVSPIAGYPADRAGIRPQDAILEIDGKSTAGLNIAEAVTKIRGPKGTTVKLRILRSKKEDLSFTLTREDIKIPSVKSEIVNGNIGYLQITQFNEDTSELAVKAAQGFKDKQVKGIVLDLRGNPGGLLSAAVDVSSLWLKQGDTVLQEKRSGIVVSTEEANDNSLLQGIPTIVLINEGSASASEITAGALKDHGVATLYGVKSFGKGSVQQIKELAGGGELKVTIARWYRPNGANIDKKGISPDKEIKMTEDDYKNKRDPQKDAAVNFIKNLPSDELRD